MFENIQLSSRSQILLLHLSLRQQRLRRQNIAVLSTIVLLLESKTRLC